MKHKQAPKNPTGLAGTSPKRVGEVTAEERDEVRMLFERKNALLELFKTLAQSGSIGDDLYDRIVADLGKATTRLDEWWAAKSVHYQWENVPGWQWRINFDDGVIYLDKA